MTGRAAGYCAGSGQPGWNSAPGWRAGGRLPGRGFGFGRGPARGMGRGRGYCAGRPFAPADTALPVVPSADERKAMLEAEANELSRRLDWLRGEIDAMTSEGDEHE